MEQKSLRVSVLSAVFNEETHIAEMIDSLTTQSLLEWEALFVDDGSTDRTADLIEAAAARDHRIRLVQRGEKIGKVAAFNRAFAASCGEVIVLCAGDDILPAASLRTRYNTVGTLSPVLPCVGYFKIRTFSEDSRFDGMVVPRGAAGSRSGGSITMNRTLADLLFPIDEALVSEDIWLGYAAPEIAQVSIDVPEIVLNYRIHAGNSNPRQRNFIEMNESLHLRQLAWRALVQCDRLTFKTEAYNKLLEMAKGEDLRYRGRTLSILALTLPLADRIAMMSSASRTLFFIRTRFYKFFSGRRGK